MRHFLAPPAAKAVSLLASGVLAPPLPATLVPRPGAAQAGAATQFGTGPGAVTIPAITPAAKEKELSTSGSSTVGKSK